MTAFKDNFSWQSDLYVKFRPHYPDELYKFLSSLTKEHTLVWDCGTGNGQAAIGLANYFDNVMATDPSQQQIENSIPSKKVKYLVEKAESTPLENNSVDLITIANALHWFNFDEFYTEVKRVIKKEGIIAAWAYGLPSISVEVDKVVKHFHDVTLNDFWQPENRLVEKEYSTIPFPFQLIDAPPFYSEKNFTLNEFILYLNTWSATQRFITHNGSNPTEQLKTELSKVWKGNKSQKVTWKLTLKVEKV